MRTQARVTYGKNADNVVNIHPIILLQTRNVEQPAAFAWLLLLSFVDCCCCSCYFHLPLLALQQPGDDLFGTRDRFAAVWRWNAAQPQVVAHELHAVPVLCLYAFALCFRACVRACVCVCVILNWCLKTLGTKQEILNLAPLISK